MLIIEKFSGGIAPRPPPPRRSGASRLHASLGTFGPSIAAPGVRAWTFFRNISHCVQYFGIYCLSNAIHCVGQNIKSLEACVCVCGFQLGIVAVPLLMVGVLWFVVRRWKTGASPGDVDRRTELVGAERTPKRTPERTPSSTPRSRVIRGHTFWHQSIPRI